jgi:hypothetical protein
MTRINLLTDAPKHNLALMKISTYHKALGDTVTLNEPQQPADKTYGSWLFSQKYFADVNGGPGFNPSVTLNGFAKCRPDYSLYPHLDYSLGYTWAFCFRDCGFCVVPKQHNPREHHSIWEFHDPRFNKICLLNNNTFSDPQWRDTFQEIWDANLTVHDENGYDIRLLDDEKAEALKRTKFDSQIHFAWDFWDDGKEIFKGLELLRKHKISAMFYVLIGHHTTRFQDTYRCQLINFMGSDPYPMPFNRGTKQGRAFKRFICLRGYRKYKTIAEAWKNYD